MKDKTILSLVKKAKKRNRKAFAELCERKVNEVIFLCVREMGNYQDGQDAAQEVFVRMQKSILSLKEPEAFNVWLNRLIHYTCSTIKRDSMKHKAALENESFEDFLLEETLVSLPEDYVEDAEHRNRIVELIDELPDSYRSCVVLHYYQGLSYAQIAQVLNVSAGSVNNNMRMARKYLKRRLEAAGKAPEAGAAVSMLAIGPLLSQSLDGVAAATVNLAAAKECLAAAGVYTAFAGGVTGAAVAGAGAKGALQIAAASLAAAASVGLVVYSVARAPQPLSSPPMSAVASAPGHPQGPEEPSPTEGGEELPVFAMDTLLSGRVRLQPSGEADPAAFTGLDGAVLELVHADEPDIVLHSATTAGGMPDGGFQLPRPEDGRYQVRLRLPAGASVTRDSPTQVRAASSGGEEQTGWVLFDGDPVFTWTEETGDPEPLDIEVELPSLLTGRVRLFLGGEDVPFKDSGLPGAELLLLDPQGKQIAATKVDEDGNYQFDDPMVSQRGNYTLQLMGEGTEPYVVDIPDAVVPLEPGYAA